MNKTIKISIILLLFLFSSNIFSQIYSPKDIVNVYDPFTITIGDMVLNTNDEDFKEHNFIIILTITIGPERIFKFLYKDDCLINNVKSYNDDYWAVNLTARKNNVILVPALNTIANNGGMVTIRLEGYTNLTPGDETMMSQLSTGYVYTSSSVYGSIEQAYKFIATSADVNKPNSSLLTSAEVLQRNIATRPGVFYLGNPMEVSYAVPEDPKKVIGTNLMIQGQKKIESKTTARSVDQLNFTITKYTDVKIVQGEGYYNKIRGVFNDIINLPVIDENKREGLIARCNEVITEDLVIGRKTGVYMNNEVIRQFTYLMNFLKAGIRAKSDTASTTNDFMKSDEREALTYMETNLKENDFNLNNQYLYDDYINSSVNRGSIQKDIDIIRRYYQLK